MSKPEWGVKRLCQSCGTKFYDLQRSPILCPRCGAVFDPDTVLRSRRTRSAPASKPAPERAAKPAPAAKLLPEEAKEDEVKVEGEEELEETLAEGGEETLIEDTSELGEDDDVSEVAAADDDGDGEDR